MKRCSKKILKKVDYALITSLLNTTNCYKDLFLDYGRLYNMINVLNENLYSEQIKFQLESITEDNIVLSSYI